MKNLNGTRYEPQETSPRDIPPGAYFGYHGCIDLEDLGHFKQISADEYISLARPAIIMSWGNPAHGSCPLHPLKGLCLDGVTR